MDTNLAIVIPAYKAEFLSGTLSSLANQTDKRFNVYIGDDCSPANLENIVAPFLDKMSINYRRFPHNAGKNDLTGHWTRCLEMMNGEEFFCMFSDDDIMEPECISSLYKTIETYPQYDVYHFDINIIGSDNSLKCECPAFPPVISAEEFFEKLYNQTIDARMPEFVFRTEHFIESGGFVPFKKAYRSDNASVMSSASGKGIRTINGKNAKVLWRDSGVNISSSKDKSLINDMSDANIAFFNWVHSYFRIRRLKYPLGLKTDAVNAMSPFITTAKGAEGLDFRNGEECIIAETAETFADSMIMLSSDMDKQRLIAKNALDMIYSKYNPARLFRQRAEIYDTIQKQ